jgi:hypothetical protein
VKNEQERKSIFDYLEAYIMRRMVCHANTKNYSQLFGERLIGNNVLTKIALKNYVDKQSDKTNYMPSDVELKEGFKNSKLVNKQATGILYFIESKIRNRAKHSTALLGLDRYSLEHVMPKKWENNWNSVATEQDKINRNRKLLTLGNLTIITASLNSSIRDSNWDVKKNGRPNKPGLTQYASGLDTFSQYLSSVVWNEQTITDRANFLYDKAVIIWTNK